MNGLAMDAIRVGDWRVIFTFEAPDMIVVRIKHRSEVFKD
jgi:mRNA-degrading endonuclease RelE of RelBE toxin-antitoxin system